MWKKQLAIRLGIAISLLAFGTYSYAEEEPPPATCTLSKSIVRAQKLLRSENFLPSRPLQSSNVNAVREMRDLVQGMAQSEAPEVRLRAMESCVQPVSSDDFMLLLTGVADPDPRVRHAAQEQLDKIEKTKLAETFLQAIVTQNAPLWRGFKEAMPQIAPRIETYMATIYQDNTESTERRCAAATALAWTALPKVHDILAAPIYEADPTLAQHAAQALLSLHDTRSVPVWCDVLQHPGSILHPYAVQGLGELGGEQAFDTLLDVAKGNLQVSSAIQRTAIQTLAQWPRAQSVPVLIEILETQRPLRRTIIEALRQRTGVPLGDTIEEWLAWWHEVAPLPPEPPPQ